jgi:hypothetical protein
MEISFSELMIARLVGDEPRSLNLSYLFPPWRGREEAKIANLKSKIMGG